MHFLLEPGLKSKQKTVGYPHNIYATTTVNHRVHNWVRRLPPAACITSFDTMKLFSRNFLVSINLISLLPVTSVCGVFSNRILTSRSGKWPRTIVIVCIWDAGWDSKWGVWVGASLSVDMAHAILTSWISLLFLNFKRISAVHYFPNFLWSPTKISLISQQPLKVQSIGNRFLCTSFFSPFTSGIRDNIKTLIALSSTLSWGKKERGNNSPNDSFLAINISHSGSGDNNHKGISSALLLQLPLSWEL